MREWLQIAFRRDVRNRALKVAAIVGTILTGINQGNLILAGEISTALIAKAILTYCVPYCVSTYAGVEAIRDRLRAPSDEP